MGRRPVHSAKPLAAAVSKVTNKPFRSRGFATLSVINEWHAIVGTELSGRTTPERLGRDGTLSVRVSGPAATELQHQEPQIIERIARYFGYKAVHRLKFIQGPLPTLDSPKSAPPLPPSSRNPATGAHKLGDTRDGPLRAALARLGAAVEEGPKPHQGLRSGLSATTLLEARLGQTYNFYNNDRDGFMITRRSLLIHASAIGATTAALPVSTFWTGTAQASAWEKPGDMAIGAEDAPVTVVEYFSLTCPHCREFHVETYKQLKKTYIDTGKVRFVSRDFPLNRPALHAAILARCAGPDRYFPFIDTLFNTFDEWTRASDYLKALEQLGQLGGVSAEQFRACLNDEKLEASVLGSIMEAQSEYDVGSTSTFIVNGKKYEGGMSFSRFSEVIDRLLPNG